MFCVYCGTSNPDEGNFCSTCGKPLRTSAPQTQSREPDVVLRTFSAATTGRAVDLVELEERPRRVWPIAFVVVALLGILLYFFSTEHPEQSSMSATDPKSQDETQQPLAPTRSSVTLHPYDLLKDPFRYQNKIITLDLNTRPLLYDGVLQGYTDPVDPEKGEQLGFMALRFNRMLSKDIVLYDITCQNFRSSESDTAGQLAVKIRPGEEQPSVQRDWEVEATGTMQGTNAFGAALSIPMVKFSGYH